MMFRILCLDIGSVDAFSITRSFPHLEKATSRNYHSTRPDRQDYSLSIMRVSGGYHTSIAWVFCRYQSKCKQGRLGKDKGAYPADDLVHQVWQLRSAFVAPEQPWSPRLAPQQLAATPPACNQAQLITRKIIYFDHFRILTQNCSAKTYRIGALHSGVDDLGNAGTVEGEIHPFTICHVAYNLFNGLVETSWV